MKQFLFFCFVWLAIYPAEAQRLKKADKAVIENLKSTVYFLASDELEGRRTGTKGEKLAYEYLASQLQRAGIAPAGTQGSYLQSFEIPEGKQILPQTSLSIDNHSLKPGTDFFPFVFSANKKVSAFASPAIKESNAPWFLNVSDLIAKNANNPHFDLTAAIKNHAEECASKGASALVVFQTGDESTGLQFEPTSKSEVLSIPVVFVSAAASEKYLGDVTKDHNIQINISIGDKKRTGTNVVGYLDNGAATTVVLGAHYDHLGYGEDKNSLWTGKPDIHYGADDNASGTAVVLELARMLPKSKLKQQNYVFIFFSGEELGLFGSKYYTEHPTIDLSKVNYMINLDMVGRLNPESKTITIGGYGTSPSWNTILNENPAHFKVKYDSSGIGPSDHTSFYLKDIPVLFFFTGTHTDYHKPGDVADKIDFTSQYRILQYILGVLDKTNGSNKLAFLKTKEPQMGGGVRFTVSLGVMPDYTYSGRGVHIDGVLEGKAAEKAGIKTGDVIIRLGEFSVTDVNEYMTALSKFKKGDSTTVRVKRGAEEMDFAIQF